MNTTTRRLAGIVMVMFLALLVSTTWIQFFAADRLNNDPRNARALYAQFGTDRGPIVVGGEAIVDSVPVDDEWNYQREYAQGRLYAPLTGYYSLVSGTSGIERAENDFLAGSADALWVERVQNILTGSDPQGSSVELTIDPEAQQAAWDALGDQRGAVVALEPSTGRILALVSKPTFDPNDLASHDTAEANQAYLDLLNDEDDPLLSRASNTLEPPGSTFKLVTTAAALESGEYTADSVIDAPSTYTLTGTSTDVGNFAGTSCASAGEMTLAEALRISCNTAYLGLAGELGAEAMNEQAEKFGFGSTHDIPFTTSASQYDPDVDAMSTDQVELSGIGQGSVLAHPLQVAMVSAAIANGGELMEPYSVDRVRDAELEVVEETRTNSLGRAVSTETASALTDMMVSVVESGSGTSAQISGVPVAGKTGTAQHGDNSAPPHVWFTGFAPADDPQVAVAVIVDEGGALGGEATGGRVAAPIAKAVIEAVLNG
ncbi:cell elongation-specific peptidoglycan D,D-transpeptidase [Isoptericola sp. CG 20/1183]|uniref:Cell elongation-specific peptidoglycan D,D-transpeptidase n=1 Tax=Isoptericola halotolerans TaxID=300560 RepID=A0ABX5EHG5_9MICO|nr:MULTISPECIES: penicillin-binding protein 2 [Isoptericola]MCK0116046.1 penicillin-binding protein 2 [Isoptericola sp. S6320L]PRZ08775.1 cell elongation-specific peptidoglycan D,D-transpeptidase [Isoptericola halotolerans]PRZ10778.1 cell elongation-specific peptidoglycan D,D-transpeptidase [Isoptericola sp. CG 20/1183]